MSRLLIALCVLIPTVAHGQTKFPYQAAVETDINVRSGPGMRYYPTDKLPKGSRVVVRRHDIGGWYMINPPAGSFSWIRAEYVDRQGQTATVNTSDVVVRIGSAFGPVFDVIQRRLSKGDPVSVLGEQTVQIDGREVVMLKISPPPAEYRWVKGDALTPLDAARRRQNDVDPYAVPSNAIREEVDSPNSATVGSGSIESIEAANSATAGDGNIQLGKPEPFAVSEQANNPQPTLVGDTEIGPLQPSSNPGISQQSQLREIDNRFRTMIKLDTSEWNIDGLEQDYSELHQQAASPAMRRQVELRFPALRKYQKIKREFDDFVQLTNETAKRDAELLSLRGNPGVPITRQTMKRSTASPVPPTGQPQPQPTPVDSRLRGIGAPGANSVPPNLPATSIGTVGSPVVPTPVPGPQELQPGQLPPIATQPNIAQPQPQPQPTAQTPTASVPKLIGAGIVQRSAVTGSAPGHVLLTPQGRILAYLVGDGVDLNALIGKPIGIQGRRGFRRDLGLDLIEVTNAIPVRLRP